MNILPSFQQKQTLFRHNLHRPSHLAIFHPAAPDQNWAIEIYFRSPVAEHMNMRWLVIIDEDDEPKPSLTPNDDHIII